jgi:hypothetical protein
LTSARSALAFVVTATLAYTAWLAARWLPEPLSSGELALFASRAWDIKREIAAGHGVPWWGPAFLNGHSYALHHAQALYLLPWTIFGAFFAFETAGKLTMLSFFASSAIAMFFCARHFVKSEWGAALAALAFLLAPEHLVRIGAVEHVSVVAILPFVPLVWMFFARALEGGRLTDVAACSLASAAMVWAQNKQALVQLTYLAAYFIWFVSAQRERATQAARAALQITLLTAFLSAFAVVPALVESPYARLFEGDTIESWQRQFALPGATALVQRGSPWYAGCVVLVLAAGAMLAGAKPAEERRTFGGGFQAFFWMLATGIALGCGLQSVWSATLSSLRAPTSAAARTLSFATLAAALFFAFVLARRKLPTWRARLVAAAATAALLFVPWFRIVRELPLFADIRAPEVFYDTPHTFFFALLAGSFVADWLEPRLAGRAAVRIPSVVAGIVVLMLVDAWPYQAPFAKSDISAATIDRAWNLYAELGRSEGWGRVYTITSRFFHLLGPQHGGPPHAMEAGFAYMAPRGSGLMHMASVQSLKLQRAFMEAVGARWILFDKSDRLSSAPVLRHQLEAYRQLFPAAIENEDFVVFANAGAHAYVRGFRAGAIAYGDSSNLPALALQLSSRGYALVHADGETLARTSPESLSAFERIYVAGSDVASAGALPPEIQAGVMRHDDLRAPLPPRRALEEEPLRLVSLDRPTNERVRARLAVSARCMAVISESYYPFWRATVDGTPSRVFRVSYGLLGVSLGPGDHDLELVYERPTLYPISAGVSGATLAALLSALLFRRVLRRRSDG